VDSHALKGGAASAPEIRPGEGSTDRVEVWGRFAGRHSGLTVETEQLERSTEPAAYAAGSVDEQGREAAKEQFL